MPEKRVMVYLDTGATKEHLLIAQDDDDYIKQINYCLGTITSGKSTSILGFTTPLCFYKVQNIIAIEFLDPPSSSKKLPIGFRTIQED